MPSGIGNREFDKLAIQAATTVVSAVEPMVANRQCQLAATRHGVPRIHGNVQECQLELARIDLDRPGINRHAGVDFDIAVQRV
jgi:hypothetical protein